MIVNKVLEAKTFIYQKGKGFWFIECRLKVVHDKIAVVGGTCSSSTLRAKSYMPEWGNKRYKKKTDALLHASTWRDLVVKVVSTGESVAEHIVGVPAIDESIQDQHTMDVTTMASSRADALRSDDMQLPNNVACIETKGLDTSVAHLVSTDEEMHDFCDASIFLTRAPIDSGFGAEDNIDWQDQEHAFGNDGGDMDDEERWDYITPTMPLQEAALLARNLLEPSAQVDTHRAVSSSLACDGGEMSPTNKRARRYSNGGPLPNDLSTNNQGCNNRNQEQEIVDLRLEVEVIKRELSAARMAASKNSLAASRAKQLLAKMNLKRARGARPNKANPDSDTYKKWFRRQVDHISNYLVTTFGRNIVEMPKSGVDDSFGFSADYVDDGINMILLGQFLAALTRKHEGLESCFLDALAEQRGVNAYKQRLKKVEKITVDAVQAQLTSVAVLLLAHLRVSHAGYQTLVNATSWATSDGDIRAVRVLCPLGTPMCRWPPLYKVLAKVEATTSSLGLKNLGKGAAHMDCKLVLIDQILFLSRKGLISLVDGLTIWVQILGDATGVWRSLKMNGTTIVLKVNAIVKNKQLWVLMFIYLLLHVSSVLLLMLMRMPMLMMLALTLMHPLDAHEAAAFLAAADANADANMPNVACHLAGAYVVLKLLALYMHVSRDLGF
jgi:hypothetical protein